MLRQELKQNLENIRKRIAAACAVADRSTDDVLLLAVSKKQPDVFIEEVYALGIRDFGENYVNELKSRRQNLSHLTEARWHLIGPLQTNKIRTALEVADVFHAVDSIRVLTEIGKRMETRANSMSGPWPVYLQVNIDNEPTKAGFKIDDISNAIRTAASISSIKLLGLMAIPEPKDSPEQMRHAFRTLKVLAQKHDLKGLSMGMSHDFEVAIQGGSTVVRVGSLLFGARPLKPQA